MRPCLVLLDRDGTLSLDRPDRVRSAADLDLYPEAAAALAGLARLGFLMVVVTNQSAVGRGLVTPGELDSIHHRLTTELARRGAPLSGIYHCPHRPEDGCECRKPRPGLLRRAMAELGFGPADTYMVGDAGSDVEAGTRAGVKTILVDRSGRGPGDGPASERSGPDSGDGPLDSGPDFVAGDLAAAADWIIDREIGRSTPAAAHLVFVGRGLQATDPALVEKVGDLVEEARRDGRVVFVAGNGGSSATAAHFVADLRKGARRPGERQVRALCLSDNAPSLTAWANDEGYATVFEEQLRDWVGPGDVLVAISVSGTSANVVRAATAARTAGGRVIALTRDAVSPLGRLAHVVLAFPGLPVEAVEDCQAAVCHAVAVDLRRRPRPERS